MKADWDKLGDEWHDSTGVVIGDVDCTSREGKPVCDDLGVDGYPTVKYFTASTGRSGADYSGGRTFGDLRAFVEEELHEACDAKTREACSEEEIAYLDKMAGKAGEKWSQELARLEGLAGQAMTEDKSAWLAKRTSILEQLLGRPRKKPRRWSTKHIFIICACCAGAVALGLLLWCFCFRGDAADVVDADAATQAKKPEEEKKED